MPSGLATRVTFPAGAGAALLRVVAPCDRRRRAGADEAQRHADEHRARRLPRVKLLVMGVALEPVAAQCEAVVRWVP